MPEFSKRGKSKNLDSNLAIALLEQAIHDRAPIYSIINPSFTQSKTRVVIGKS
jgi:hypothetical protein